MKKLILGLLITSSFYGCSSYTSVTHLGKGKVAVVKNDNLLLGLTRGPQVWICKASTKGLKSCMTGENP